MRTLVSYIKAFPYLQRIIYKLGIKIERIGYRIRRTLRRRRGGLIVKFTNYCGSDLGKFDLAQPTTSDPSTTFKLPGNGRRDVPGFAKKVFDIEGVTYVCVEQYSVSVVKAKHVNWEEVRQEVKLILHEQFAF